MDHAPRYLDESYEHFLRMDSLYSEFAKRYGESYYSLCVLHEIGEHPEGVSQKQLVQTLHLPKQTIGSITGGFEKRGLVALARSSTDGRSKLCSLTEAGRTRCTDIMGTLRAIELSCLRRMEEADIIKMLEIDQRYLDLLEAEFRNHKNGPTHE